MDTLPFLEDIYPPDLLYAVTIRSPIAKGKLRNIHVPALPDNYTLITAKDIPGENRLENTKIPILAQENLNYIGEPIAILLGPDKTKLEELASGCEALTYEEKPVFSYGDDNEPVLKREIITGNTLETFHDTDRIVTGSYKTGIQEHWYAEPIGAISWLDNEQNGKKTKNEKQGLLVIRTATQWTYHVKRSVMRVLGIDSFSVNIEPTALNLHMDGKLWYPSLIACHAALGTFITKKPVRLVLTREEDFLYTPKRFSTNINIVSTIDDNGIMSAANIDISVNLGAYEVNSDEILDQICLGTIGLYNFNNISLKAKAYCTNIPPQGPFSGFGLAQGLFAMERHVSLIADMVSQDPAEWREKYSDTQIILPSSKTKNNITGENLIKMTAKMSDYNHKWASYELLRQTNKGKKTDKNENPRGIGIALGFQGNGMLYPGEEGSYSIEVTLTKDCILEIKTSITSPEDYSRIWARVVKEIMSIESDMVRIISSNAPDCGPSCTSRNITAITKLVEKCCIAIRKQRFHDPLPITVRRSIKPQNGTLWGGRFTPSAGKTFDISGFTKLGLVCAVVEVSIDLIECIPIIRGVWLGVDGGKIISANRAKRRLFRGAAQALGWAFTENIEYINGIIPRTQYDNFTIFSPVEIPPIHIDFIAGDSNEAKGISDLPFTCIPAAFLQAVSQAMDHSFKTIPLKRKDIWEIVRARNLDTSIQGTR
jgi:CO/xanthine dehydrogenase Mo-binding subunit